MRNQQSDSSRRDSLISRRPAELLSAGRFKLPPERVHEAQRPRAKQAVRRSNKSRAFKPQVDGFDPTIRSTKDKNKASKLRFTFESHTGTFPPKRAGPGDFRGTHAHLLPIESAAKARLDFASFQKQQRCSRRAVGPLLQDTGDAQTATSQLYKQLGFFLKRNVCCSNSKRSKRPVFF